MRRHRECGEDIRWGHRDDDNSRWLPPLEFAGHAYVFMEGSDVAVKVPTYKMHLCDPDKVVAWQEYLRRMEEIKQKNPEAPLSETYQNGREIDRLARERDRLDRLALAETIKCPRD